MKELSTPDKARLAKLESKIQGTIGAFVACGTALAEIRDSKLYLSQYSTFDDYCRQRWGWERTYAHRLIEAAMVTIDLRKKSDEIKMLPIGNKNIEEIISNESQARALTHVPPNERVNVLNTAIESGNVTATGISAAAEKILGAPKETNTVELDCTGHPIPSKALSIWRRSDEPEMILFYISKARSAVRNLQDTKDILYCEVNMNSVYADLCNAFSSFKLSIPHAVCPACQGRAPDTCTLCSGRGMISKFRYDTAVPQELKAIRDKSIKKFASKTLGKSNNVKAQPPKEAH